MRTMCYNITQKEKGRNPEKIKKQRSTTMKIEITGEFANVFTAYNPDFVKQIKTIGGARWDAAQKAWKVPANTVDDVRSIMQEVYGETDVPAASNEKVNVRLTFEKQICEWRAPVTIFGKTIASAFGRDSGARVGDGVSFVSGRPQSGGSMKNWETVIPVGCVCVLHDVPKAMATQDNIPDGVSFEIEQRSEEAERNALLAERERLIRRIAEIDALLEQ